MEETKKNASFQSDNFIEFGELVLMCLRKWYWFVLSIIIAMLLAFLYILVTPSSYTRTAEVLIKSESKNTQNVSVQSAFNDMGGMLGMNINIFNEFRALMSTDVMLEAVQRLNLNMDYSVEGTFHDDVLYGSSLPIKVTFLDVTDHENVKCDVTVDGNDVTIEKYVFYKNNKKQEVDQTDHCAMGDTLSASPFGRILVERNPDYLGEDLETIHVSHSNLYSAQESWSKAFNITHDDEMSEVLTLSIMDVSTERGDDILNMVIKVYNEKWIKDKNQMADGTSMFINERLKIIESELSTVDNDISSYKSKNFLPDVKAVAEMYMQENANISNQLRDLNAQLYTINYIRDYLSVQKNQNSPLPVSSGLQNVNIESQIAAYNEKMLNRNNLEANSSSENDLVKQLDKELGTMRRAILVSIDNQIASIDNQVRNLKKSEQKALSHISSNPKQAEMLLSAERQQAVKEALYLFLLQKREENELSQSFTAYNTRIIKQPGGSVTADSPNKRNVFLVALSLALIIPLAIIYVKESTNTTLRGKKDLENLPVPLFAEIPMATKPKKWWQFWSSDNSILHGVVERGNRNAVNEAFRVLRTNLEFLDKKDSKVMMFTSFNAESGKSFLCLNTALSFAFKDKKVLMIDGDMRHASLSKWADSPAKGLNDLLSGKTSNMKDVIVKSVNDTTSLDLLPVGEIPDNPSELIGNGRLGEAIAKLKETYDYIFIDCPPVDVVADARIIETYTDEIIFAIRSGLLDRSLLNDLSNLYVENRFKDMRLILNGTPVEKGKYSYRNRYHSSSYISRS